MDAGRDISKVLCETTIESHISVDAMLRDSDSRGALLLVFPAYVQSLVPVTLNMYVIMPVCCVLSSDSFCTEKRSIAEEVGSLYKLRFRFGINTLFFLQWRNIFFGIH